MKKIKLMLVSLSVLAVVGGALAFTAKSGTKFCYTTATSGEVCTLQVCPILAQLTNTTDPTTFICYAASFNGGCVKNGADLQCTAGPINRSLE